MQIDERAINAVQAVITQWVPAQMAREVAQNAIEAYEAACWRPIEEAPRDGKTEIEVKFSFQRREIMILTDQPTLRCLRSGMRLTPEMMVGAMFRMIEPPNQSGDR